VVLRHAGSWQLQSSFDWWIGCIVGDAGWETSADQGQIILRQTVLGPMPTTRAIGRSRPMPAALRCWQTVEPAAGVYRRQRRGLYSTIVQLSKLGQGDSGPRLLMISPDATQVAYVATKGPTDYVMVVNHKESPVFERISAATFAPVGHRLAFVASKGGKQYLVVDGKMSPGYARVAASELAFTRTGKHLGYVVADQRTAGQGGGPWWMGRKAPRTRASRACGSAAMAGLPTSPASQQTSGTTTW